jgi:hypothetical protein
VGDFLDQRFNYLVRRRAVDAMLAANVCPAGKRPCILNSKRRSRAAFKNRPLLFAQLSLAGGGDTKLSARRRIA